MSDSDNKKVRRIILMGRSGSGKTTLLQALHNQKIEYQKTQEVIMTDDSIDTPGEYIDQSSLWRACINVACDADIVVLVHDATKEMTRLPSMFSLTFAKPVIGVITKTDAKDADIESARDFLTMAGARHIVETSSYTGEGIEELRDLIENLDLSDY